MSEAIAAALQTRADNKCELCEGTSELAPHEVPPTNGGDVDRAVLLCSTCRPQVNGEEPLDGKHWFCLNGAIWSEVPAVQVVSYRLLQQLASESWAADLLGQAYLEESVLAWAQEGGGADAGGDAVPTLDSNGAPLADGDSVTLIKDLDVKGTNFVAKRGTLVKNIRLIPDDPDNVEGRVNKIALVLKTKFLKKSS